MILLMRIEDEIAAGADLPVRWSHICPALEVVSWQETEHEKNMLRKGILDSVATERHLSDWHTRPDIVCFSTGIPKVLIEVVDIHSPERPVIDAGLPVLEIHAAEPDD